MDKALKSFEHSEQLVNLAADQTLYLIVDGSQLDDLQQRLYQIEGFLNVEPVYLLPPYDQLREVSPFVIEATEPVKSWFFELSHPTAGYFIASTKPIAVVCQGFRDMIKVESPYGSKCYLKMAHSECAWVLLETNCALFWRNIEKAWLPTREGWKSIHLPEGLQVQEKSELKLTDEQWKKFEHITWRNTLDTIKQHVEKYFPDTLKQQNDPNQWLSDWVTAGYNQRFATEGDLLMWMSIIGLLGETSVTTNQYPDIYQLITTPSVLSPSQRIEKAGELALQYSQWANPAEKSL